MIENFLSQYPWIAQYPWLEMTIWLVGLIVVALLVNYLSRTILMRTTRKIFSILHAGEHDDVTTTIRHIANITPALICSFGINLIPNLPPIMATIIQNVANAFIIFTIALAISSLLNIINRLYEKRDGARLKPIKGFIQIFKLILFAVAAIMMLSILIDRSPVILLSGLGAMAAVLILVFQDTLLSLVAGIQISSTDMVRMGDWIEIPNLGADGDVIEIALHTVKVQNFDKTITTVPIRKLVTDPFKNWRGMQESGGRRIKRSLFIDQTSIGFLNEQDQQRLSHYNLLENYFSQKNNEIIEWNNKVDKNRDISANMRHMTNIGTFRAYVSAYIEKNPGISATMTQLVRQMAPTSEGLPLEIYCFTNTVAWNDYERIQSDMFDHFYSVLPDFGLRIFQNPSSSDFVKAFTPAMAE